MKRHEVTDDKLLAVETLIPKKKAGGGIRAAVTAAVARAAGADKIAAQLTLTQARNAKARAAHRKRTIQRLWAIGIKLHDLRTCRRPQEQCWSSRRMLRRVITVPLGWPCASANVRSTSHSQS